ncbi:FAD-dependent thymidylate synthase [Crocosphaera sp. Alani8]|uniref:FAD-dependent thymidylate synthase n=1 Tax=Crocosphaera sp. Alani8 TaxID=3038952 RepID=UPI00313A7B42
MNVKLISITPKAEELIAYCARVSSNNQNNPEIKKLLKYCVKHGHWSIFEQASMTVEIRCPMAISVQILRHRSFCFQQFSKRYQKITKDDFYLPEIRLQDSRNRQNSIELEDNSLEEIYQEEINVLYGKILDLYEKMLDDNIAKECARFILPEGIMTKMYMTGNIRSFIHYLEVRKGEGTQKEHRQIALEIDQIFKEQCPIIWDAVNDQHLK